MKYTPEVCRAPRRAERRRANVAHGQSERHGIERGTEPVAELIPRLLERHALWRAHANRRGLAESRVATSTGRRCLGMNAFRGRRDACASNPSSIGLHPLQVDGKRRIPVAQVRGFGDARILAVAKSRSAADAGQGHDAHDERILGSRGQPALHLPRRSSPRRPGRQPSRPDPLPPSR